MSDYFGVRKIASWFVGANPSTNVNTRFKNIGDKPSTLTYQNLFESTIFVLRDASKIGTDLDNTTPPYNSGNQLSPYADGLHRMPGIGVPANTNDLLNPTNDTWNDSAFSDPGATAPYNSATNYRKFVQPSQVRYYLTHLPNDVIDILITELLSRPIPVSGLIVGMMIPYNPPNPVLPRANFVNDGPAWVGAPGTGLEDWAICDGSIVTSNSYQTPNKTNKFSRGVNGSAPLSGGGANSVTLANNQMPAHTHNLATTVNAAISAGNTGNVTGGTIGALNTHIHNGTTNTDGVHQHATDVDVINYAAGVPSDDLYSPGLGTLLPAIADGSHNHNFTTGVPAATLDHQHSLVGANITFPISATTSSTGGATPIPTVPVYIDELVLVKFK